MKLNSTVRVFAGALTLFLIGSVAVSAQTDTARYRVTFDAEWSAATHPQDFPSNPHFSPLAGVAHGAAHTFWELGGLATNGIESMAETGSDSSLLNEYRDQIGFGTARETFGGRDISVSPGGTTAIFKVSVGHPLVTLVTMIAPSPDWFVGVSGLSMLDGGDWADEIVVDLAPIDSGTDSGTSYTSPNQNTNPAEPIFEITGFPFLNGGQVPRIGTFTFTRIEDDCVTLVADDFVAGEDSTISVTGGTPGESALVLWGAVDGLTQLDIDALCANVEFDAPTERSELGGRIVVSGQFDSNGNLTRTVRIPEGLAGRSYFLQAGITGSCPDSCESNRVSGTVQ